MEMRGFGPVKDEAVRQVQPAVAARLAAIASP
jgi:hypothetical protein